MRVWHFYSAILFGLHFKRSRCVFYICCICVLCSLPFQKLWMFGRHSFKMKWKEGKKKTTKRKFESSANVLRVWIKRKKNQLHHKAMAILWWWHAFERNFHNFLCLQNSSNCWLRLFDAKPQESLSNARHKRQKKEFIKAQHYNVLQDRHVSTIWFFLHQNKKK